VPVHLRLVPQSSNITAEVDLLSEMSCDPATLNDVRGVFLWIGPGQFDLDNLRAK
jgi:mannan endo-1,4-beta-mannosidase